MDSCCSFYAKCLLSVSYKFTQGQYYRLIKRNDKWYICSEDQDEEISEDNNYVYNNHYIAYHSYPEAACFEIVMLPELE